MSVDITVAANGCTDATAELARRPGVRVIEVEQPSKAQALNLGDAAARGFPRIYLDADIEVPAHAMDAFSEVFATVEAPLAAGPRRRIDVAGRPLLVRAYFTINSRLPAFQDGLMGRGMIALSRVRSGQVRGLPDHGRGRSVPGFSVLGIRKDDG